MCGRSSSVEHQLPKLDRRVQFPSPALFCLLSAISCLLFLNGCATAPYETPAKPQFAMPGIYHRVEKGQTLWKISKIYNADLDEIARVNRIPDTTSIEPGQLIFIPSAQKKQYTFEQSNNMEDFSWPLKGRVISGFGQVFNDMINKGLNIQKVRAQDVLASRSGKVTFYDNNFENFGKTIIVDHGDGYSTIYARNAEVLVKVGDYVQKGAVIAKVGSTGNDRNTYLHFEIRKGYIPQNPYFYLP
jgi:murein DD-endopeptidase MepM/ murein hydrolase activator NlpD